jgi:hypothetical protein
LTITGFTTPKPKAAGLPFSIVGERQGGAISLINLSFIHYGVYAMIPRGSKSRKFFAAQALQIPLHTLK